MNYKDIKSGFAYLLTSLGIVTVIGKNAGWVNAKLPDGSTRRYRAKDFYRLDDSAGQAFDETLHEGKIPPVKVIKDEIDANLHVQLIGRRRRVMTKPGDYDADELREKITMPAKKVYKKPEGLRMKINGFKYRVRFLKAGDMITNRCMFRQKNSNEKFRETILQGAMVVQPSDHEYIEILSTFYKPPA